MRADEWLQAADRALLIAHFDWHHRKTQVLLIMLTMAQLKCPSDSAAATAHTIGSEAAEWDSAIIL